ncbi:unnamed protein product, partial [Closterium sp. NIES-54]
LLFNHRDDVAVVAFGCKETNNSLEEEEGYENIAVVVPHRVVDPSSLQAVHAMEQAAEPSIRSDWLSALVVSLDLLIRAKGPLGLTKGRRAFNTYPLPCSVCLHVPALWG